MPKAPIPPHLHDLLDPRPSGAEKLLAAWDGLHSETQIAILSELRRANFPAYLAERVRIRALDSPIPYVRYLAARELNLSTDKHQGHNELAKKISEDPDPLVRYCAYESGRFSFLRLELQTPDEFFKLDHQARLALVRGLRSSGEMMAKLIVHGVEKLLPSGIVSELELFEILSDFVGRPSFREHYNSERWNRFYDGGGAYTAGKDLEALWHLIPLLPEWISYVLIENLPTEGGLCVGIPNTVLKSLSSNQIQELLYRDDVVMREFRKKLFFLDGKGAGNLRSAAVSCDFDLSNDEFAQILSQPEKRKLELLHDLAFMAEDLRLVLYEAIHDALLATPPAALGASWEDAGMARENLRRRLSKLPGRLRDREMKELALYRVARAAVPWKPGEEGEMPDGDLSFLAGAITEGDTWGTYVAFSSLWERNRSQLKKARERLWERCGCEDDTQAEFCRLLDGTNGEPRDIDRVCDALNEQLLVTLVTLDSLAREQPTLSDAVKNIAAINFLTAKSMLQAISSLHCKVDELLEKRNSQFRFSLRR